MTARPAPFLASLTLCLCTLTLQTHAEEAHEHGIAELNLIQLNQQLQVEIISPAYNVFGFEHKPHSEQQKTTVKQRLADIQQTELVAFNADAQCQQQVVEVENPFHAKHDHEAHSKNGQHPHEKEHYHEQKHEHKNEHDHAHQHKHDHHSKEGAEHQNVHLQVTYRCHAPNALEQIDLTALFQSWPQLETVRAQWILGNKQSGGSLTRQAAKVRLQ